MKKLIVISNAILILLFYSCSDPKKDYLDRFGKFINEIELAQEKYDEDEWVISEDEFNELSKIEFIDFKDELTESELNQIESYRKRFKTIQIKRDPAGSLLKVLGF